jgi:hypothetical protein
MRAAGAYFVPTLTTYSLLSAYGEAEKIPQKMIAKINKAKERGGESLQIARAAGLKICSGSDVLASMQPFKSMELGLKADVLGAQAAILSATKTNAELFGMAGEIGTIEAGKIADVIVVAGEPLDNVAVLQDAANVVFVMRDGSVFQRFTFGAQLQRLHSRFAAEARQIVFHAHPVGAVVEVDVCLWRDADTPVHVRQDDVDHVWATGRFAEQRAATGRAEAACAVIRGAIAHELVLGGEQPEVLIWHREPRDIGGAVGAAAHRTVTVRAEEGGQLDLEAYGAAQATSLNGFGSHGSFVSGSAGWPQRWSWSSWFQLPVGLLSRLGSLMNKSKGE